MVRWQSGPRQYCSQCADERASGIVAANQYRYSNSGQVLKQLLNTDEDMLPLTNSLEKLPMPVSSNESTHPLLALQNQNVNIASAGIDVVKNENKPEFSAHGVTQRSWSANDPFSGCSVTAAFPLFGSGAYRNKVKMAMQS